jgi:predicted TPR repeat methyltransferase
MLDRSLESSPAADVFAYGDLRTGLRRLRVLRQCGIAEVSLEAGTDSGFKVLPSGRFAHHRGYLQSEAIHAGLKLLELTERQLRHQQGAPVAGYLVCLQKP